MSLALAALISWAVTVTFGTYLFVTWLARGGLSRYDARLTFNRPPPYFPAPLVIGHALLASSGLVVWIVYVLADWEFLAWVAFVMLMPVDLFGFSMFTRWLGSRRARNVVYDVAHEQAPAESRLPMAAVFCHGILASATVLLVLATAVGIGRD